MSTWGMPANGSLHGVAVDRLMGMDLRAMFALFLLSHLLLVYALLSRKKQRLMWGLGALPLVGVLAVFVWMTVSAEHLWASQRFTGAAPDALQVEVFGVQFQWYFRYPGPDDLFGDTEPRLVDAAAGNPLGIDPKDADGTDDIVSSVLVLPVGKDVDLTLRAHDVIHGFFIPGMRIKQNAVPGLELHVHFTPEQTGSYPILCTQVCGSGHARMQAVLQVMEPEAYAAWLDEREQRLKRARL